MTAANIMLNGSRVRRVVAVVGTAVNNSGEDFNSAEAAGGLIACLAGMLAIFSADRSVAVAQAEEWGRVLADLTNQGFDGREPRH